MTTDPQLSRQRVWRDDRGATLALVAITLPVLLSFTGLGVEAGLWYVIKRHNQSAADFAALSGAYERAAGKAYLVPGPPPQGMCGLAERDAARNGFTFASFTCPNSSPGCTSPVSGAMCANNPPVLGSLAGVDTAVEVILAQQQNTFFAGLFSNLLNVTINTRAVANVNIAGTSCSGALSPTAAKAVNFSGNSTVNFSGCGIFSNSNAQNSINFQGNTSFTASWFQAVGNYNTNGNSLTLNVPVRLTDTAPVTDPYTCNPPQIGCAGTITYTLPPASAAKPFSTGVTLQPGLYVSVSNKAPMDFTGSTTTTLCPGVYYLDGDANNNGAAFEVHSGATVLMGTAAQCPGSTLTGVTIIATSRTGTNGGAFDINSGATVKLSAPTTSPAAGIPSGILFYQDPAHADTSKGNSTITANSASDILLGTIYTPKTNLTYTGNSNSTCFIMLALTVTFSGTSNISGNPAACTSAGITAPAVLNIALAE